MMNFFKAIGEFFSKTWVWLLLGLLALSALVWFVLPLIKFGETTPFNITVRLIITLLLVIGWSIWTIIIIRNQPDEEAQLQLPNATPEEVDQALELLRTNFDKVLDIVSNNQLFEKYTRLNAYSIPWYLVVGASGSGRSSLLRHSGLPYPVANESHQTIEQKENELCQWWFSKEAVFLDTHADLLTNLDEQSLPAQVLNELLGLLRRYRRKKPVDGLILTIDISDLLQKNTKERANLAHTFRTQLQKLDQRLLIQTPIYITFTKMDLLCGFTEFFNYLNEEERKEIMGFTFDYQTGVDSIKQFSNHFTALVDKLNAQLVGHLYHEKDARKAAVVNNFVLQLYAIKDALDKFLIDVFESNRFHQQLAVRGVFFTSALQQGVPVDYLAATSQQTYGIEVVNETTQSGAKAYFIHDLFTNLVFAEKNILLLNTRQTIRQKYFHIFSYAVVASIIALFSYLWTVSFWQNNERLAYMSTSINNFHAIPVNINQTNSTLLNVLPMLDRLGDISDAYNQEDDTQSLHWGLYQGTKVDEAADQIYRQNLIIYLMPQVVLIVTNELRNPDAKPSQLYNNLRMYLMLANPQRLNKPFAESWMSTYWARRYQNQPEVRQLLDGHFHALLALGIKPITMDPQLVKIAREKLKYTTQAERDYFELQELAEINQSAQIHISSGLDTDFNQVFGPTAAKITVPNLYTYNGYYDVVKANLANIVANEGYSSWVLGDYAEKSLAPGGNRTGIGNQVKDLYFRDYVSQWNKVIADLKVQPFNTLKQAATVLNIVSSGDSPIYNALKTIDENTAISQTDSSGGKKSLSGDAQKHLKANQALLKAAQPKALQTATSKAGQFKPKYAKKKGGAATKSAETTLVDQTFAPIHQLFEEGDKSGAAAPVPAAGGAAPAGGGVPIDKVMNTLGQLDDYVMDINTSPNPEEKAYQFVVKRLSGQQTDDPLTQLENQAAAAPQPLRGWLQAIAQNTWGALLNSAAQYVQIQYQNQLLSDYHAMLSGRYPFVKASKNMVNFADFTDFFQTNGKIDTFFKKYVQIFADTSKPRWEWKVINNKTIDIEPEVLAQFQRADQIKTAFFSGSSSVAKINFSLQVDNMSTKLKGAIMTLNNTQLDYRHGPRRKVPFVWEPSNGQLEYSLFLQDISDRTDRIATHGDWGLFMLFDQAKITRKPGTNDLVLNYGMVSYLLSVDNVVNPFAPQLLGAFRLPEQIVREESE